MTNTQTQTTSHPTVQELLDRFAEAWQTNDGGACADHFADDGTLINPFGERADGRAAVAAMYVEYFGTMLRGTSTTFGPATVRSLGGVDATHAFVDVEQTISATNGDVVLVVHLAALLGRDGDGWCFLDARPYTFPPLPA